MRNGHVGYLNRHLYTDIESFEVFEENGKLFAVQIEKIQACKPEYASGGFVCHCTNQDEVWGGDETKEVGEPFALEKKYGFYGHTVDNIYSIQTFNTKAEAEEAKRRAEALIARTREVNPKVEGREYVITPVYNENGDVHWYSMTVYHLTKTGRRQRRFVRLGTKIVDKCHYKYDYNF